MTFLSQVLQSHRNSGTFRNLDSNRSGIDFSSNDYLGLSRCQIIRAHLIQELQQGCPLGATGSRLLSGQTEYHERVENFLAQTFNSSSALLFGSGYLANMAVLSSFAGLDACFFSDERNHASLIDGMKLCKSPYEIFRHNDLNHLESLLAKSRIPFKIIVTESVFSMDGDLAPLRELMELAERHGAWLIVDEAHATGIFGTRGLGCLSDIHSQKVPVISVHTGSKALGGQGAFILCDQEFRDLIINRARSFIFTTGLSPIHALQIEYSIREVLKHPNRGRDLLRKVELWQQGFPAAFQQTPSPSPIVPLILGSNTKALMVAEEMKRQGFDVRAVRFPTVPVGRERLRLTLKSFHLADDLKSLSEALKAVLT
jgi:8-amino-7-oxononanoate synthase